MNSVLLGLPSLAGVFAGIVLYARPLLHTAPAIPLLVLAVACLFLFLASQTFVTRPILSAALLEGWSMAAVAIIALCTQLILWLTVSTTALLDISDADLAKAASAALVGAATTFLATAWVKEIEKADGFFFASSQFRKTLARGFAKAHSLPSATLESAVCNLDSVSVKQISGWGFSARRRRAKVMGEYLRSGKQTHAL
jgi:hypothetical protein